MKDIDFDELDKAVNSLMATTPQADPPTPASQAATPTEPARGAPSPVVRDSAPDMVTVKSTPVEISSNPSSAGPAPAMRRTGGRFMDMVSTPSEARNSRAQAPTPAPVASASREGLTITPRQPEVAPPTQPAETQPIDSSPTQVVSTPDPIDFSQPQESSSTTEIAPPVSPPLGSIDSPFLTDAKVEKRPLNASTTDDPLGNDAVFDLNLDTHEESDLKPDDPVEQGRDEPPINPQVAELDSDLVAIESSDGVLSSQTVDTADAARLVAEPSVPLGASSIPQQYTKQPSSGDQSHAAIYDASQYPEPLAHPAKSKSGWLWILWVVLLLGVGAGGAVVLYNLGIIP